MQFYNTTNTENSLVHEAWDLVDADVTTYPLAKVTRRFNFALEKLVGVAINSDGVYEYDDTNYTDLPVGTGTLVEGQQSYSFASEYLKVKRVKVKDTNLGWALLKQIDQADLQQQGLTIEEYFGLDSSGNPYKGMPTHYDILGDSIRLYPAPTSTSVTLSAGLKIEFVRTADLFTTSDTTQEPGIPSIFHYLLPTWAALKYAQSYKKDRVNDLRYEWETGVKDFIKHFSRRNPDRRDVMTMKKILYI